MCKKCRRVFQRDVTTLMDSDKYCEQCQNLWCLPGTIPPFLTDRFSFLINLLCIGATPESMVYNQGKALLSNMYCTLIENAGQDPSLMPPPEDYSMTKSKALTHSA